MVEAIFHGSVGEKVMSAASYVGYGQPDECQGFLLSNP